MEGEPGVSTVNLDKSRVLDVKPLRSLVPVFTNPPGAPPFVNMSPLGPFPSGFTPFYPFNVTPLAQDDEEFRIHTAVPLRSRGVPQTENVADYSELNGDQTLPTKQGSNSTQKRTRKTRDASDELKKRQNAVLLGLSLSPAEQENGNRELVNFVMLKFDAVRRRLSQTEDIKEPDAKPSSNRSHFLSSNILMSSGIRTNARKRIGVLPGIEIGDLFYFRMEMCVVGLHTQPMSGIDYIKDGLDEEGLAVSVVSSGAYDDATNDIDVLIYTGHGGGLSSKVGAKDKVATDQKLVRGNLALDRSSKSGNEIRVIRGFRDSDSSSAKIYVYDGLYTIKDSWIDKGQSGATSFKYKMVRNPGQPSAFSVWQSVQKWKKEIIARPGLIVPDISSGAESVPVSLVNDVDYEKGPSNFSYTAGIRYPKSFNIVQPSSGCICSKECATGNPNCACIRKNGGNFPYTGNGILVIRKPLVYECGSSCQCKKNCKNRVLQSGLKARVEVFKTNNRGWGLRSWDPIRAGTFICEYAGLVIDQAILARNEGVYNDYLFDTTRAHDSSFKWNYDPGLVNEEPKDEINEESLRPSPLLINAKDIGNIGRFMNHSCSPNVFWQLIATEESGESVMHVGFFALQHIPPLTELTYDYGLSQAEHRRKQCLCGSQKCKGYFG